VCIAAHGSGPCIPSQLRPITQSCLSQTVSELSLRGGWSCRVGLSPIGCHSPPPMATISATLSVSFLPSATRFSSATAAYYSSPSFSPCIKVKSVTPSLLPSITITLATNDFVLSVLAQRAARFRCCAEPSSPEQDPPSSPDPTPRKASGASPPSLLGISTRTWSAGVAGLGFLETGYLTYLKLTGSEAFCPVSGGSCGDVLKSDYSEVFGNLLLSVLTACC
jgi:hypothetical protein